MVMKKTVYTLCFVSALFIGCTSVSEEDLIADIQQNGDVTYVDNIKAIIDNNCINCHSDPPVNGAPVSLVDYNDVRDGVENGNLIGRISLLSGDPGAMPFGGPRLPQNLINLIIEWEADGLLED